jgi:hypothetical protein
VEHRPSTEIDKHADGDALLPAASWTAQDNGAALLKRGAYLPEAIRSNKRFTDRLHLPLRQQAQSRLLFPAYQKDVFVAAYCVAFDGQALSFAEILVAQ